MNDTTRCIVHPQANYTDTPSPPTKRNDSKNLSISPSALRIVVFENKSTKSLRFKLRAELGVGEQVNSIMVGNKLINDLREGFKGYENQKDMITKLLQVTIKAWRSSTARK